MFDGWLSDLMVLGIANLLVVGGLGSAILRTVVRQRMAERELRMWLAMRWREEPRV
jgi:hypothetical protein